MSKAPTNCSALCAEMLGGQCPGDAACPYAPTVARAAPGGLLVIEWRVAPKSVCGVRPGDAILTAHGARLVESVRPDDERVYLRFAPVAPGSWYLAAECVDVVSP